MKLITLRIKKKYLEQIKTGEKVFEYREFKNYYKKLFKEEVHYIKLHYQKGVFIIAEVKNIEIEDKKYSKFKSEIIKTDKYYKLSLGRIFYTN